MAALPQSGFASIQATDWGGSWLARQWDRADAERTQQWNMESAAQMMNFQERMASTQHQREVKDLIAAGLNPMLSTMHQGAAAPQGAGFSAPLPHSTRVGSSANMGMTYQTAAQVANIEAQTDLIEAQAENTRAHTTTYPVAIDKMKQEIAESIDRIQKIQQDVKTGASTAAHLDQQVINLKESIPQLRASTNQLHALTELHQAQAIERLTASGVNTAQAKEILQRVNANLPEIERQLGRLEAIARNMAMPGHMANEAAQDSLVGHMGAYLRALVPLQGVMGAIPIGRAVQKAPTINKGPVIIHRSRE